LLAFYLTNSSGAIVSNIPDSLQIRIDTSELKLQLNFMMQQKVGIRQQLELYKKLKAKAENLISLIREEYQLD
jgi:hypothetical protein